MTDIRIAGLSKRFGETAALAGLSIDIPSGSFVAVLGPSGCGKTTLLRLIAGFEAPDEGSIHLGGDLVANAAWQVPPESRGVGVVFQSYALWPHMSVGENVAYPLRMRKVPGAEAAARVEAVLGLVGLAGLGGRRIEALSGGQRQRVALARCLVADSRVILFDEPLANLDMHLRAAMAEAFRDIHARTGATMIYITHDQAEALALADTVVVMNGGRILQAGPPDEIYRSPENATVASFVGRGALLRATLLERGDGRARVRVEGTEIETRAPTGGAPSENRELRVLLRPEGIALDAGGTGLPARVRDAIFRGSHYEILAETPGGQPLAFDHPRPLERGEAIALAVADAWIVEP